MSTATKASSPSTPANVMRNYTYDEIEIGQKATYSRSVSEQDIILFAAVSGDVNPVHLDEEFAKASMFGERIAHGMWTGGIISAAIVMTLPGPGSIYRSQSLRFRKPVKIGDTITVHLEITAKNDEKQIVTINCDAINQHGESVARGVAEIVAPAEKIEVPTPRLPHISINKD